MSLLKKIKARTKRRALRNRKKMSGTADILRVSVFRSLKHIYAQLINDQIGKTVVSFSSQQLSNASGDKKTISRSVGRELAALAKKEGITTVVFDRGQFLYHGRVQELAEGLREGGLKL
ncbi:MAG TPA: 50S ribosomal protein L18 [Candidatus Babeliales bacterium]|nr:50S ribosomal protein L18 [Candidatus Babeliales bacterium]